MKTLCANNYYYLRGGSERVYFDEMKWLTAQGHDVVPFSRKHPRNEGTASEQYFPEMIDFEAVRGFGKALAAMRIIYSRSARRLFGRLLDHDRPDLVHGHNIFAGLTSAIIDAAKERGIPFVLTLHDLKLICPSYLMLDHGRICSRCVPRRFWKCTWRACHKNNLSASLIVTCEAYFNHFFRKCDWVSSFICPSRFLMDKHAAGGVPRHKLTYLPNGVETSRYKANVVTGDYVLCVGRLSPEKGVMTLLRAISRCGIPVKLAGMGPSEAKCKELVAADGLLNVDFCGYCEGQKLQEIYQGAAFIVVPSECYENAPMSILEAFAYGKPVLGSNIGGIPELVMDGVTGYLFEAGNVDDLREKLVWMWSNRQKMVNMGKNARRRVEEEYCLEHHMQRLVEIYEKAIG